MLTPDLSCFLISSGRAAGEPGFSRFVRSYTPLYFLFKPLIKNKQLMKRLTWELLTKLGFHHEGRDITNKPAYRLKIPHNDRLCKHGYSWELQIVLGDYPDSNPNSGIVSLHRPELKDCHCQTWEKDTGQRTSKKIDFIQWREDGQVGGIKYITFKEQTVPIAWHVTTLERLNQIYTALTRNAPLKIKTR